MKDKRRYDRFLLATEIDQHKKNDKKNITKTKSKNISLSGICITTDDEPLIKGGLYILRFILPGQSIQIVVEGKVVWNNGYTSGNAKLFDNGLEFINISKDQVDMIEEYKLGSVFEL